MYIYKKTEPRLWTVGFYNPNGNWEPEGDYSTPEEAADRVRWLNGGNNESDGHTKEIAALKLKLSRYREALEDVVGMAKAIRKGLNDAIEEDSRITASVIVARAVLDYIKKRGEEVE